MFKLNSWNVYVSLTMIKLNIYINQFNVTASEFKIVALIFHEKEYEIPVDIRTYIVHLTSF